MSRRGEAYLGGHTSFVIHLTDAPHEAACDDDKFLDLCLDILSCAVPPRNDLARLFARREFQPPEDGWNSDSAGRVFKQAYYLLCVEMMGGSRRVKQLVRKGWKPERPKIVGVGSSGEPYAWSPEDWR